MRNADQLAQEIVSLLMNDLMNRGGIQNAFEALDGDVFGEIVDTNTKMIREYLEAVL